MHTALTAVLGLAGVLSAARLGSLVTTHVRTRSWLRYLQSSIPETAAHPLARR
jgi:hypothetical protein